MVSTAGDLPQSSYPAGSKLQKRLQALFVRFPPFATPWAHPQRGLGGLGRIISTCLYTVEVRGANENQPRSLTFFYICLYLPKLKRPIKTLRYPTDHRAALDSQMTSANVRSTLRKYQMPLASSSNTNPIDSKKPTGSIAV